MKDIKQLRDEAYDWAKANLVGRMVEHYMIEQSIELSQGGLKHTLKGKNMNAPHFAEKNSVVIESIYVLPDLIENAQYVEFQEDSRLRDNVKGVHILENSFIYQEQNFILKIVIKETSDKMFFYDHSVK